MEEVYGSLSAKGGQGCQPTMINFVLDTDALTLLQEGHPGSSGQFLTEPPETVAITVLSVEEQLSGWYTQVRQAKRP